MKEKLPFSPEQQNIIDEREKNLLVSASAGSGKTTVMIERIAKLLEEGKTTLGRILVLTFTNNSANDMKEKLYKKLSESTNKNARKALFEIVGANISNIHQFCKRLIQKYFFVCGVDPAFEVISENEALVFKERALDRTIEEFFFSRNEDLDRFLESNFEKRNFDKIKEMILSVFTFLSILDQPEKWLNENATKNYENSLNENEGIKILCENARFILNYYITKFDDLISHINRFFNADDLSSIFEFRDKIFEILSLKENDKMIETILNFKYPTKKRTKNEDASAFYEESAKDLIEKFKKDFDKIKESFSSDSVNQIALFLKSSKASTEFLCELAKAFVKNYEQLKKQKYLLDFDDLESKAKLLLDDEKIREEIRNSFDFCFVDEYQDINILQEAIIGSVSKNAFYFGVGDAKQAIYGFRLCSPEIFISKFENYKQQPNENMAASLNKNYRSKINILRFVNKIFDVVMTKETAQIDYKNEARFKGNNLDEKSKVNIKIILDEKNDDEAPNEIYSVKNNNFSAEDDENSAILEAKLAFAEIKKLLDSGVEAKDIAILSRNRDSNNFIKKFYFYLQKQNLPLVANFRINILSRPEIALLHYLIKLINNFKDDVTLFKVLSFPYFNFSLDELLKIRNETNEKTFSECFLALENKNEKIKRFIEFVKNEQIISQSMSVAGFAEHLINVLFAGGAKELQSDNSLNIFEAYLNFLNEINANSLTEYCKLTEKDELLVSPASSAGDNAVNFCTIHSSKGLEYKHVILIGAGKKLNLQNKGNVLIEEKVGIGVKGFDEDEQKKKTPIYNAINIKTKRKNFAEEIRLLYVALTRAKEGLTVIGTIKEKDLEKLKTFENDFEILKSENYLSLILQSFSAGELSKLKSTNKVNLIYEKNEVGNCEIISSENLLNDSQQAIKQVEASSIENLQKANENFNKIISTENVYLKNNVSAVVKSLQEEVDYSKNLFSDFEKSSSFVGTKYHEMFAKLNFNKTDANLKIDDGLDEKYFNMFFESEVYKLCKNKKVQKELPFLFFDSLPKQFGFGENKILLQGVIDLIVENGNDFIVIDYKASHASDDQLKQRYSNQLKLYAYCAERILNKPCKKMLIYKIFDGKTIEIE